MYIFSDKLGEGTFGQVILGLPKNSQQPLRDEERKIGHISATSVILENRDQSIGMIGHVSPMKTPTIAKVAIKILNK